MLSPHLFWSWGSCLPHPSQGVLTYFVLLKGTWSFYVVWLLTLRRFVWVVVLELGVPIAPTHVADKPAYCFLPLNSLA